MPIEICITGATGYVGRHVIPVLVARGHRVRAFTRPESARRVPAGSTAVPGDPLDARSIAAVLRPGDTVVHLVGTPHPNPSKADEFARVDLASIQALADAANQVPPAHVVYVSVAHPAPIMRAYIDVRSRGEQLLREAHLTATILRPWYVLGPGRRWPVVLAPLYWIAAMIPATRAGASRLGLITIDEFVRALTRAVEDPPPAGTVRVVEVPEMRRQRAAHREP